MLGFAPLASTTLANDIGAVLRVYVTGVDITGGLGSVLVWGGILAQDDPSYVRELATNPGSWSGVSVANDSGWVRIDDSQSDTWVDIAPEGEPSYTPVTVT